MADIRDIERYISEYLSVAEFRDYCVNGLQVEGRREVNKLVTGVSVSERLFEAAIRLHAEAIMVHHGLFWKSTPHPLALTGVLGRRVRMLNSHNINLLGYHLPLDAHPVIGNNALLAQAIELTDIRLVTLPDFSMPFAAVGEYKEPIKIVDFFSDADKLFDTNGIGLAVTDSTIKRVFVVAGSGGGYAVNAVQHECDLLLTGSITEPMVREIEELGLSVYVAGHYNSEKLGVKALGSRIAKEFKIEVEFIDVPNPV